MLTINHFTPMSKRMPIYTKELRLRWYRLVDAEKRSVSEVCRLYGVPRKTFYKWRQRDFGRISKDYHSRRPHPFTKLTHEARLLIEQEKLRANYGPRKMKLLVRRRLGIDISATVIYRYYLRKGLIRRPQKRLPWYQPLKESIVPTRPGEVVQLDIKYVWEQGKRRYQRTFIDLYTGMQYATVADTKDDDLTIRAFEEAKAYFPFPIFGIQSDNGGEFRGTFHKYLGFKGVAHYFIPKNSPNWNGAVERAHGVIDQEYYLNPGRPWKSLAEYLYFYNYERIHIGKYLRGRIPIEKFQEYQQKLSPLNVN